MLEIWDLTIFIFKQFPNIEGRFKAWNTKELGWFESRQECFFGKFMAPVTVDKDSFIIFSTGRSWFSAKDDAEGIVKIECWLYCSTSELLIVGVFKLGKCNRAKPIIWIRHNEGIKSGGNSNCREVNKARVSSAKKWLTAGKRTKLREAQLIINVECAGCHRREENKAQGSEAVQLGMTPS